MTAKAAPTVPKQAKLVTVAQMQALEAETDARGHSYAAMMETAGKAVADTILERFPHRLVAVVLVGPGNNGGDGLVAARHLYEAGLYVGVITWKRRTDVDQQQDPHLAWLLEQPVSLMVEPRIAHFTAEEVLEQDLLSNLLDSADIVVDALLGTGGNRPIEGTLSQLLDSVATEIAPARATLGSLAPVVVAVDAPSGLNCDTGAVDPHALAADLTVTFAHAKMGHYKFPGAAATGEIVVADIGVPSELADDLRTFALSAEVVSQWLPARNAQSHKGTFGKVLLTVGSVNYPGAAHLACAAAGRVGAGLVTGAVPEPVWAPTAAKLSEATWLPLPTGDGDASGGIAEDAVEPLAQMLPGYNAMVLGCGLGQKAATQRFVVSLLADVPLPATVIDADGLNCLAQEDDWPRLLPARAVLTPHPAEMARLCKLEVADVVADRWSLAREKAVAWNTVILLKGPYTVIAEPGGLLAVLPVATAALATAGTGDVLSGTIGGLLAQGVEPFGAACLGAWLHGTAGEECAAEIGLAGVLASDLLTCLPAAMVRLR